MRYGMTVASAVALAFASGAVAQVQPGPALQREMPALQAARDAYNKLPDTPGTGPFPAHKEVPATLSDHVLYRPLDLSPFGATRKLGVLVWGNGGCSADGASARWHLAEIASHGYIAIAPGGIFSGPGAASAPPRRTPDAAGKLPPVATTAADVTKGIDWAIAENGRKGSPLYGKLDPSKVAVAGHSCGGLQALQAAGDPRVKAVLIHNSGVFADGSNPISGMTVDKALLRTLHTPVIYFLGGPKDVAYPNGMDDYDKISGVPVMTANLDVGHGGTFTQPNGGLVAQAAVAWLDWQLNGDAAAAKWFVGADCKLCTDPQWNVQRKGF